MARSRYKKGTLFGAQPFSVSAPWLSGPLTHYKISTIAAGKIVREAFGPRHKPPRPGYEMSLPDTTRNGGRGYWVLSNYAGKYELRFHYK